MAAVLVLGALGLAAVAQPAPGPGPSSREPPVAKDGPPVPKAAPTEPKTPAIEPKLPAPEPKTPPVPTLPGPAGPPEFPGAPGLPAVPRLPDGFPPGAVPFQAHEPIDPPAPVVTIRVRAPARSAAGKPIEYHLIVENRSAAAAHHVRVRDRLSPAARFVKATPEPTDRKADLIWDLETLGPGARKEIVLVVEPTGADDVQNRAYVQFEHGQAVRTRVDRPALRLEVTAPPQTILYDSVTVRMKVTNTGASRATGVVLKNEMPPDLTFLTGKPSTSGKSPLTWDLGTLEPGQARTVEYQASAMRAGTFENKAEVSAAGGLRQQVTATLTVGEAKLSVLKTGPAHRLARSPATYRITVRNTGTMPATGVQVVDELPPEIHFLSAGSGGRAERRKVVWSLGTLAAGARRSVEVVVQAERAGRFTNVATVTADRDLKALAQAETRFDEPGGAAVELDKGADPVEVGGRTAVTVRLVNPGKTPVPGVALKVAVVSGELSLVSGRGETVGHPGVGQIEFGPVASLPAGGSASYTVELKAEKPGEGKLRAELTGPGVSVRCEESIQVLEVPPPPVPDKHGPAAPPGKPAGGARPPGEGAIPPLAADDAPGKTDDAAESY